MAADVLKASSKASGRLMKKVMIVTIRVTDLIRRSASRGRKSTITIPTSGKNVIRLRRLSLMRLSSLYQLKNDLHLPEDEYGDHDHHAQNHGQGIVVKKTGLRVSQPGRDQVGQLAHTIDDAIDHLDVEGTPAESAERLDGIDDDSVVELVNVPLVVNDPLQLRESPGKGGGQFGLHEIHDRSDGNAQERH